jgi:hypothetical protein
MWYTAETYAVLYSQSLLEEKCSDLQYCTDICHKWRSLQVMYW